MFSSNAGRLNLLACVRRTPVLYCSISRVDQICVWGRSVYARHIYLSARVSEGPSRAAEASPVGSPPHNRMAGQTWPPAASVCCSASGEPAWLLQSTCWICFISPGHCAECPASCMFAGCQNPAGAEASAQGCCLGPAAGMRQATPAEAARALPGVEGPPQGPE